MANIPIAIAIVAAAVIIVLGFGYFTANPKILETTTIPTTSVPTTTSIVPFLSGVSQNITAFCRFDNSTGNRWLRCIGQGDRNTLGWTVLGTGANNSASSTNLSFNYSFVLPYMFIPPNGYEAPTKLTITIHQKQDGPYFAGSYCLRAYRLVNVTIVIPSTVNNSHYLQPEEGTYIIGISPITC